MAPAVTSDSARTDKESVKALRKVMITIARIVSMREKQRRSYGYNVRMLEKQKRETCWRFEEGREQ